MIARLLYRSNSSTRMVPFVKGCSGSGDVQTLKRVGLLQTDAEGAISVPWDRIAAEISLAA